MQTDPTRDGEPSWAPPWEERNPALLLCVKHQEKMAGREKSVIFAADSIPKGVSMGNFSVKPPDVSVDGGRSAGSLAEALWRMSPSPEELRHI